MACREFSGQSGISPQRSAHSLSGMPVGGLAVGKGAARGERGLSQTKTSGLSSSKKRGDAMRRQAPFVLLMLVTQFTQIVACGIEVGSWRGASYAEHFISKARPIWLSTCL